MEKIVLIHGDVTIYETSSIPATAKKVSWKKGFVVERGEGVHTHVLENECEVYVDETTGRMYFKQLEEAPQVNHEEHGLRTIKTDTGISYTDLERVFDYEDMEARNVID